MFLHRENQLETKNFDFWRTIILSTFSYPKSAKIHPGWLFRHPQLIFQLPPKTYFLRFSKIFFLHRYKKYFNHISRYNRCQIRKFQEKWCIFIVLILDYRGSKYVLCPKYFFITKSGRYPTSSSILDWTGGAKARSPPDKSQ